MKTVKYETTVVKLGPLVQDFIDSGILVFFGMDAPEELAEFTILHEHTPLRSEIVAGDVIQIDEDSYNILCVGEVANANLSNLGHFVIKFNGNTEPEMPGDISLAEQSELPEIKPGTVVKFVAGQ
jgi:PTS system glucitol/sorbitol-specific IIA component